MEMNKLKTSQVKYKFTIIIYSLIQTQFVHLKFPAIEEKKKRNVWQWRTKYDDAK